MILSLTDFIDREYKIPNQSESADLLGFIEQKEDELLIDLLGVDLYNEIMDGLEDSAPEQKFLDLLNGSEYTFNGVTYKWRGLVDLLQPAIYSMWINVGSFKFTNIGWVQNSPQENSTAIDFTEQFTVAYWNKYCEKVGLRQSQKNSFYGYMKTVEDDFDSEWIFTLPKTQNRFGL